MIRLFSGKSNARYIKSIIRAPATQPHFTYLFSINVAPTKSSPPINSQSTTATPERLLKNSAKGPFTVLVRNPEVGDPPFIQDFSAVVENPRPKVLSKNAQRKTKPIA